MSIAYEYMTDEVWAEIAPVLKRCKVPGGPHPKVHDRDFIEGYLLLQQSGFRWRDLPERFGTYDGMYERFRRWTANGTWDRLFSCLQTRELKEAVMLFVDSTVIRAHQCASGARRKKGGLQLRRSDVRSAA